MDTADFFVALMKSFEIVPTKELYIVVAVSPIIVSILTEFLKRVWCLIRKIADVDLSQPAKTNAQFISALLVSTPVTACLLEASNIFQDFSWRSLLKVTFVIFLTISVYGKIASFYYKGTALLNIIPFVKNLTLKNMYQGIDSIIEDMENKKEEKRLKEEEQIG